MNTDKPVSPENAKKMQLALAACGMAFVQEAERHGRDGDARAAAAMMIKASAVKGLLAEIDGDFPEMFSSMVTANELTRALMDPGTELFCTADGVGARPKADAPKPVAKPSHGPRFSIN